MRTLPFALILSLLIAAPAAAATRNVKVGDNFFKARSVTVGKGTVVKWNWVGANSHDVFVRKGPAHFHSAVKTSGTYKHRMRRRGTYRIVCLIHDAKMRMTLRVV